MKQPDDASIEAFVRAELAHGGALDKTCDCCPHELRFHRFARFRAECTLCPCVELYNGGCCGLEKPYASAG